MISKIAVLLVTLSSISAYADISTDLQKRCEGRAESCRIVISPEETMLQKISCSGTFMGATPCTLRAERNVTYLTCGNNPFTRKDLVLQTSMEEFKVATVLTDAENNVEVITDDNMYVVISDETLSIYATRNSSGQIENAKIQLALTGGDVAALSNVTCD